MKEVIEIPKASKETIVRALKLYEASLNQSMNIDKESNEIAYEHFDVLGLLGIFRDESIQIEVRINRNTRDYFVHSHKVDFPMWENY